MQFLEAGRFFIELSEIICIYVEHGDLKIALKHPIQQGDDGVAKYIIIFPMNSLEAVQTVQWVRRHCLPSSG
jgi:hypothetical protein